MADGTDTGTPQAGRTARIAWLLSLATPMLVLLGLTLVAERSEARRPALSAQPQATIALEEEADEEWEAWEEGEWEEWEEEEAERSAPECLLRSANAHAATRGHRLKLTIGYTAYEPVSATIEIRKGANRIGSYKRLLGKSGVLRFASELGERRSGAVTVRIHLSRGGAGCPPRRLRLSAR